MLRRDALLVFLALLVTALDLVANPVWANDAESRREGVVIAVKGGPDVLMQQPGRDDESADALFSECCPRSWTATGAKFAAQIGWGFTEHFRISGETVYGRLEATDVELVRGSDPITGLYIERVDLKVDELGVLIDVDWIHALGFRVGFAQGLGVFLVDERNPSEYTEPNVVPSFVLLGRAGYELSVVSGLSVGAELTAGLDSLMPEFSASFVGAWM